MKQLIEWLASSSKAKVGAAASGGTGVLVLVFMLHQDVLAQLSTQEDKNKKFVKEYVQLSMKPVQVEITNLKEETKETKNMVKDIHNYLLKKGN